ncbi:MAG TPA: 3-deoxy-7-phosphoheptulonate synthase [Terriglobales bacterium]|nr:3-deoxy-7-phosphoheptulonate synthase [Terriglobales bacterium]
MLIRMQPQATAHETHAMRQHLHRLGFQAMALEYLGPGHFAAVPLAELAELPEAETAAQLRAGGHAIATVESLEAAGLASRSRRPEGTRVRVGGVEIGGEETVIVAGPCSVESREQLLATALGVRAAGAHLLRGGAYKPRTSTYSFQGLGRQGLALLAEVGAAVGLPVVTEVLATEDVELVAEHAQMLQVGARNMQNFPLLKKLGGLRHPVLLKRSPSATLEEWLGAAEYLLARGNDQVVLCERGIRGFDRYTRNTLDLAAVAAVHELSHLPVMVDPSHGTGRRSLIAATARAAVAVGADGVCLEVHVRPEESVSDREQAISPLDLAELMPSLRAIATACGRGVRRPPVREAEISDAAYCTM